MSEYKVREVMVADAREWRRLRIEALEGEPFAFAMLPETVKAKSELDVQNDINAWQQSGGFIMGAYANSGELLGMIGLSRSSFEKLRHRGHIWGVYITPSARRKGISKRLFQEVIRKAKADGLVQLDIEVVTTNIPSFELYKSIGFKVVGMQPRALKVANQFFDEHLLVFHLDE